jgi:protein-arginine kinase activator protein McsA
METIYIHGKTFHSCEICDKEETLVHWTYIENGKKFQVTVCKECFNEPNYQFPMILWEGKVLKP